MNKWFVDFRKLESKRKNTIINSVVFAPEEVIKISDLKKKVDVLSKECCDGFSEEYLREVLLGWLYITR